MSKPEFPLELTVVITGSTYQNAEPENNIPNGGVDDVFFEVRDGDDNVISVDMDWYVRDNYHDELIKAAEQEDSSTCFD